MRLSVAKGFYRLSAGSHQLFYASVTTARRQPVASPPRFRARGVGVESAGAAQDANYLAATGEEELGKVGAVLTGDAGDESFYEKANAT